jgi:hypothetical protein
MAIVSFRLDGQTGVYADGACLRGAAGEIIELCSAAV